MAAGMAACTGVLLWVTLRVACAGAGAGACTCSSYQAGEEIASRCYDCSSVPNSEILVNRTTLLFIDNQNLTRLPNVDGDADVDVHVDAGLARLARLRLLDLSGNQISAIGRSTFGGNAMLLNLSLENNMLLQVPADIFKPLRSLLHLNLARNAIMVLTEESFAHLFSLAVLNLTSNRIHIVDVATFAHLRNLRELWLSDNQLVTLSEQLGAALPPSLSVLRLGRNRFHCDCSLLWLKMLLAPDAPGSIVQARDELLCATAAVPEAQGRQWTQLLYSQFACLPQVHEPAPGTLRAHTLLTGTTATLTCHAYALPKQSVTWTRAGHSLNLLTDKYAIAASPMQNFSTTLRINDLQMTDSGYYACVVANDAGAATGNFSLLVLPALSELDAYEPLPPLTMWAPDGARLVHYLTVVGASVCAFIVIVTIISTIVYCLSAAKAARRRKLRRVLPTRQYAKGTNGELNTVSAAELQRSPLQLEAEVQPDCAKTRTNFGLRQVTFAETCPVFGSSGSVAVVQPLMNATCAPDGQTPAPPPCPVHGLAQNAFSTLPNRLVHRFECAKLDVNARVASKTSLPFEPPHDDLEQDHDPALTRQHYLTMKPSIMSPTRQQLSMHDYADAPNANANANASGNASDDAHVQKIINGRFAAARQCANGNGYGYGYRAFDDEGYNTAV